MDLSPIICDFCGTEKFYHPKSRHIEVSSRITKNKFCSKSCLAKFRNRFNNPMKSPESVKKMTSTNSDGRMAGSNNPNYRGGHTMYIKYRKKTCEICGISKNKTSEKALYVHHIDKNRKNGSPDNLQTVCASCHEIIHNRRWS